MKLPSSDCIQEIDALETEKNRLKEEIIHLRKTLDNLKLKYTSLHEKLNDQKKKDIDEKAQEFQSLITASLDVFYRMNPDWSVMLQLYSKGFLSNTEKPNSNWLQEYIHPDEQSYVTTAINKAVQTKSIFELEHRVLQANGSWGWTYSRAVPLLDENGEIKEWFGSARDFTRRKHAEDALRENEEKFSAAFNSNPNALVLSKREDGTIIEVNDTFLTLFERTKDEVIGKTSLSLDMFANPQDRDKVVKKLQEEKRISNYEIKIKPKSGVERIALLSVESIHVNELMLTTIQDISEIKQIEEELRIRAIEIEAILTCIAEGVIVYDRQGHIVHSNSIAQGILQYDTEEHELNLELRLSKGYKIFAEDGHQLKPEEGLQTWCGVVGSLLFTRECLFRFGFIR
jgi:PAS domain S-box-containing protein